MGERVKIGANSVLQAGNFVGDDSKLGNEVNLFPNVTIYPRTEIGARVRIHAGTVIGSDGFGYVLDGGFHRKVPQIGNVIIGDDVEIGANVSMDRGALGSTVIGKGTKIDNLVQIAHNVEIGEHCIVIAQVGISGSTKLGNYVDPRRAGRHGRAFENRQPGHRRRAIRRDDTTFPTAKNGSAHPRSQTRTPNARSSPFNICPNCSSAWPNWKRSSAGNKPDGAE